jgi:hypothetical protein
MDKSSSTPKAFEAYRKATEELIALSPDTLSEYECEPTEEVIGSWAEYISQVFYEALDAQVVVPRSSSDISDNPKVSKNESLATHSSKGQVEESITAIEVYENVELLAPIQSSKSEEVLTELEYEILQDENIVVPTLVVSDRQLRHAGDEAIRFLVKSNVPPKLFVRLGALCAIVYHNRDCPVIRNVNDRILAARLSKICNIVTETEGGEKDVYLPRDIVSYILAEDQWPFPALEAITHSPTIRQDGTVSQVPGYDSETRLIYHKSESAKPINIPEKPTTYEIEAALNLIDELLRDFRFDCQQSKANAIALLISPVIQPAIMDVTPLFLIDAPTAGSGKSKLAGVAAIISTGKDPRFTAAPTHDAEWTKKITAILSGGPSLVVIDNVKHVLQNEPLTMLLTAKIWEDRPFGKNTEMISLPNCATWVATGNNIRLGGDIPRRCIWIRLDPKMAKPHEREDFLHPDLEQWVKENRERILSALLTLCRSWYADDCPQYTIPTLGSFEKWSKVVGSILAHAGVTGFMENRDKLWEQSDTESTEWEEFLAAWVKIYGATPITPKELIQHIGTGKEIANVIPESISEVLHGKGDKCSKIGIQFKNRLGKRYGARNLRLEKMPRNSKGYPWTVLAD